MKISFRFEVSLSEDKDTKTMSSSTSKKTDIVRCLDESYVSTTSSISSPFPFKAVVLRLGPGQGKVNPSIARTFLRCSYYVHNDRN